MRRDLFLAFLFVIVCVAAITGLVSSRIASDEFERLVLSNTEQALSSLAFTAQDTLRVFPTWEAWQEAFDTQFAEVQGFLLASDEQETLSHEIIVSPALSSMDVSVFTEEDFADLSQADSLFSDEVIEGEVLESEIIDGEVLNGDVIWDFTASNEEYSVNLVFGLLLELEINNQQLLIVDDASGAVVADSHDIYLDQPPPDLSEFPYVTILGIDGQPTTRLYVILQNDFYSDTQLAFLANIQKGNVIGIVAGIVIALVIALIFAQQIIRPVQSLNTAMLEVKEGNWGHQVAKMGRHEIREIGQTFNYLSHHLHEQQQLRTRLVNDIAHEINTPLNLIRLEVESVVGGLQTIEAARQYLNQEIDTVSKTLEDLVFLVDGTHPRTVERQPVDVNDFVAQTTKRFAVTSPQAITLSVSDEPLVLESNPVLLERALSNLLSNAIRYTPDEGQITVAVRRRASLVEISVTDTGIGIPQEQLSHIFERFYRVDEARQAATGGRGLGLAICKEIMQQLNGQIAVESVLGQGSTFKLSLPLE